MEPEHLLSLPGGALLLSRSGTGATLRLHLSDQGPDVFTLRRRSRATLRLGSRAEFEGRGGLDCGRSAPPSGEGSTKPALASPHRNRCTVFASIRRLRTRCSVGTTVAASHAGAVDSQCGSGQRLLSLSSRRPGRGPAAEPQRRAPARLFAGARRVEPRRGPDTAGQGHLLPLEKPRLPVLRLRAGYVPAGRRRLIPFGRFPRKLTRVLGGHLKIPNPRPPARQRRRALNVTSPRPTCAAAARKRLQIRRTDGSRHGREAAGLPSVMAPARIELAHADSKSAALSTELRGLVGQYARLRTRRS